MPLSLLMSASRSTEDVCLTSLEHPLGRIADAAGENPYIPVAAIQLT